MPAPPPRFKDTTFSSYRAETPSQQHALREAKAFVTYLCRHADDQGWMARLRRWLRRDADAPWKGLYLVGPVGTGKTHLLAAMYHALHPEVRCAFYHSSEIFRRTDHPERFARRLARTTQVLCLDEVELDDPANEARLVLFLKTLEQAGVRLLATSNVEPDKFLSAELGNDRFRRFLNEEFRNAYKVIVVSGDDYRRRLAKPGHAWIGPPETARAAMLHAYDNDRAAKHWLTFDDLLRQATETEHARLLAQLASYDHLYLADIAIDGTDDALRLLRIIDDLYLRPDPPVLYFTAEEPPEAWFLAADQHGGFRKGIAEKFERTTSRLVALCEIEFVDAAERKAGWREA